MNLSLLTGPRFDEEAYRLNILARNQTQSLAYRLFELDHLLGEQPSKLQLVLVLLYECCWPALTWSWQQEEQQKQVLVMGFHVLPWIVSYTVPVDIWSVIINVPVVKEGAQPFQNPYRVLRCPNCLDVGIVVGAIDAMSLARVRWQPDADRIATTDTCLRIVLSLLLLPKYWIFHLMDPIEYWYR